RTPRPSLFPYTTLFRSPVFPEIASLTAICQNLGCLALRSIKTSRRSNAQGPSVLLNALVKPRQFQQQLFKLCIIVLLRDFALGQIGRASCRASVLHNVM